MVPNRIIWLFTRFEESTSLCFICCTRHDPGPRRSAQRRRHAHMRTHTRTPRRNKDRWNHCIVIGLLQLGGTEASGENKQRGVRRWHSVLSKDRSLETDYPHNAPICCLHNFQPKLMVSAGPPRSSGGYIMAGAFSQNGLFLYAVWEYYVFLLQQ